MTEETIKIPADQPPEKPSPAQILGGLAGDPNITEVVVIAARNDGSLSLHSSIPDLAVISFWMQRQLSMMYNPPAETAGEPVDKQETLNG